jgi:phosphoglycerate kinase
VRIDVNCPVDPETGEVTNDEKIKLHASTTIRELKEKGAKVILMSHQGRPGDSDFVSLEGHKKLFERHLGEEVSFVDDVFGPAARKAIDNLGKGEVLLLENVRFYSEELLERPPDVQAKTPFVRKLSSCADCYVNDAFAAIHRSQPSLVGFGEVLPTAGGRVIEKELEALERVFSRRDTPVVYVLGGVKVKESLRVIESLMENGRGDMVLTGGLLGNLLLAAKGYDIGKMSWEVLKGKNIDSLLPLARELVRRHGERIETPVDVAVNINGRKELEVSELPAAHMILDMGRETVGRYSKILEDARTIVMNSPLGRFETREFDYSTRVLLKRVAESGAFSVVGGGHSAKLVSEMGIREKFGHVSVGGRAALYHLSGEKTPVVRMLERAYLKWKGRKEGVGGWQIRE